MDIDSQQTLNCALSVDLFLKLKIQIGQTLFRMRRSRRGCRHGRSRNESQIFKLSVSLTGDRVVFNGEFDSGSERTLAAWIRHASRARFLLVAIPREV